VLLVWSNCCQEIFNDISECTSVVFVNAAYFCLFLCKMKLLCVVVRWRDQGLRLGRPLGVGFGPVSMFPVSSATRALILATRDSMAGMMLVGVVDGG
jgi:hypothetical protein